MAVLVVDTFESVEIGASVDGSLAISAEIVDELIHLATVKEPGQRIGYRGSGVLFGAPPELILVEACAGGCGEKSP